MIRLDRILRDYRDSGAINSLIALWGFVDDHTFVTKAGDVGLAFEMRGPDAEALTPEHRQRHTHQFESALRLLNENVRVYQYLVKTRAPLFEPPDCAQGVARESFRRRAAYLNERRSELFHTRQFLVLVLENTGARQHDRSFRSFLRGPIAASRTWLSPSRTFEVLASHLDTAVLNLHQLATAVSVQLADCRLRKLSKREAFAFLRGLVNFDPAVLDASNLCYDTHLDYFLADSTVECHRDHLRVGPESLRVLSMKEPPGHTFAHMLSDLAGLPGEFVACSEWQRLSTDRMRRDIHSRRRHFFNKRVSLVNYVSAETSPDEMLVDDSAGATVKQLGDALTEMELNGHFFGEMSLTLLLHGHDLKTLHSASAEAAKVLAAHDGVFVEESYNLLNAWLGVVPGNSRFNLRRLAVLETNCADLSFVFSQDSGDRVCRHLGRPSLATFETGQKAPYYFNLHVDDVGHTLVLGSTGSGKSFLLNFLITQLQQHDPRIVVLDLGHSYRKLATLLQGSYLELGLKRQAVTINPFDIDSPNPEQLHFLHAFTRVLIEGEDGYRLSDAEDRELYEAIENLFVLEPCHRRLFTLASLLPRNAGGRLHKWIEGGRYAAMFDNPVDTLSVDRLQVFDFESMRSYPIVLEALLFYVLHRVSQCVHDQADPGLKVCVLDEAWRLIQHPAVRSYVQEALKTWRKRNALMLLAS